MPKGVNPALEKAQFKIQYEKELRRAAVLEIQLERQRHTYTKGRVSLTATGTGKPVQIAIEGIPVDLAQEIIDTLTQCWKQTAVRRDESARDFVKNAK